MKFIGEKYQHLDLITTQKYIKLIKDKFQTELSKNLNLIRVSSPLFVTTNSGFQDDLTGVERRVQFDIKKDGALLEVPQSLAKWKRYALKKYGLEMHQGLYVDMNAIRRDDDVDNLHSIYVDQWDWEQIIDQKDRHFDYLKQIVIKINDAFLATNQMMKDLGFKMVDLAKEVFFITSQQLLDLYPNLSPSQREYEIVKKHKTVFILQIGHILSDGIKHGSRSPDYDDWNLNGDLIFYHEVLDCVIELSSMGIRVDKQSLLEQLKLDQKLERMKFSYHQMMLAGHLPLTIGGGIGQSRMCMLLLGRAHIGEVQAAYWDKENIDWCHQRGIKLL